MQDTKPVEAQMGAAVVEVEVRNVYGNDLIYPVNEKAKLFAAITGKKTLTQIDLKNIRALGFLVIAVPNQASLLAV